MKDILDKHEKIGWDIDKTLFQGPHSDFFINYINSTPNKVHHIITFRDRAWANRAWGELREAGLNTSLIKSIQSLPQGVHDTHAMRSRHPEACDVYMTQNNMEEEEFHALADQYAFWKGERAMILGCTLLVDDLRESVLPGCQLHGIEFLHVV
jgi:hypothetical protein